jgi:hypothetical protein
MINLPRPPAPRRRERVIPRLHQPHPKLLAVGRSGHGTKAESSDRAAGAAKGHHWPDRPRDRYEALVQDEAQVGVHPALVSHRRGALAAARLICSAVGC